MRFFSLAALARSGSSPHKKCYNRRSQWRRWHCHTVKLLIQAGSLIEAGSPIQAGLEMGVGEIDESEDENNEVLIDADDAD